MAIGFTLIKTAPGKERQVFLALQKVEAVEEAYPLFGEYDLIVKMEAPDFDALGRTIVSEVRTIDGVLATKTFTETTF